MSSAAQRLFADDRYVAAPPVRDQEQFEGELFNALIDLRWRPRKQDRVPGTVQWLGLDWIDLGANSLVVHTSALTNLDHWLERALPVIDDGEVGGVPGLRATILSSDSIRLYRPKHDCSVTIVGADTAPLESYLSAESSHWPLVSTPDLTAIEMSALQETRSSMQEVHSATSVLIRRIHLLHRFHPYGIDSWGRLGRAGAITEAFVDEITDELVADFITVMSSDALFPHLHLRELSHATPDSAYLEFGTADAPEFIQVRIRLR